MAPFAPVLAALIVAATPVGAEADNVVIVPAARDHALRVDAPGPLSILDWNDPEERRAHGLGDGAARRPVEAFETALCELTADPRLQVGRLLPSASPEVESAEPAEPGTSLGSSRCGSGLAARRASTFARSGPGSRETAPEQWAVTGGVTVTAPGPAAPAPTLSDHVVAPSAWGELSSHPGLIQQPTPPGRPRGDKVKYQVMRDTTLGFDGHLLRVRMTYPKQGDH